MHDMHPESVHHTVLSAFKGKMDLKLPPWTEGLEIKVKVPVDTGWSLVVGFTPRPTFPREGKSVREAGKAPYWVWALWKGERFLAVARNRTPDSQTRSRMTIRAFLRSNCEIIG